MTRYLPLIACLALLAAMATSAPATAVSKKDRKEPKAVIAGTTFTQEGFSLPGVSITVTPQGERKPKWRVTSDARGEFAVSVPAARGTYLVATDSSDHENQSETVEIYGEQRVDLIFRLARKSPGGKAE
jgi:hypothetical protein